jgi:Uma2 family endonuclease
MNSFTSKSLSLQEFFSLSDGDITYELVDGEAIPKMSPKRFHSRLTSALLFLLSDWNQGRGEVGIEGAIILTKNDRDWCPVPDLLYISHERLGEIPLTDEPCPVPPELVIEIISPEQSFSSLSEKAVDYLNAGVSRVWSVDLRAKQITIFYADSPPRVYKGDDEITDILLPDLTLTPRQIFAKAGLN